MDKISVKHTSFIDEGGRERIFNGVNLVFKGEYNEETNTMNYIPNWDEEMFADLAALGINLVRLGLVWKAIEPKPGKYDDSYLNKMEEYIDLCAKNNIYVFLDMHQDCYRGMPDWATITDSYKFRKPKLIWAEGYFIDKAVHRAFDNFWANTPVCGKGLQDHFADMWKYVANKFKDKENLFGFDVFNEPFPGTDGGKVFKKIIKQGVKTIMSKKVKKCKTLKNMLKGDIATEALKVIDDKEIFREIASGGDLLIKNFDTQKYYPFLQKIASAIREITDKGIIIMEACYYSNISIPSATPRLKYADGTTENNIAYAPHGYDLTVDSEMTNTASNNRVDVIFEQHRKTQERLQVPVITAEWGGMVPGCEEYPHLEHLLEKFDSYKWSQSYWAYWKGLEKEKIMKIIARPYPIAVPGEIEKYGFNRKNSTFTLKFNLEEASRKKAEIYCPVEPKEIISKTKHSFEHIGESEAVIVSVGVSKGENIIEIKI